MYLATLQYGEKTAYEIRQSYPVDKCSTYKYKTVFNLGESPGDYMEEFDDHIVLFHSDLVAAVSSHTKEDEDDLLEQLLFRFLPHEVQSKIALYHRPDTAKRPPLTSHEKDDIRDQVHIFDRKRLYYLRYGAVDQSRLSNLHEKCCKVLLYQSRDEREYYFQEEEKVLNPGEYLQYVYAIFNLQIHFNHSFAPFFPEALAVEEVADHFISEICRLNSNKQFWKGDRSGEYLHSHLQRYLIMFFDFSAAPKSFLHDFARQFRDNHRSFRWPEKRSTIKPERVSEIFETPYNELKSMSPEQLNRLYRKKAMQFHPDKGGDHHDFVELTAVYNDLLR